MQSKHERPQTKAFPYHVVDVFTDTPLKGNPIAVVLDADDLDPVIMQRVDQEFNLSETTFVLRPKEAESTARVRIFKPRAEMQFAGHPTIGTAYVVARARRLARPSEVVFEEGVGPLRVRLDVGERSLIWLETLPIAKGNEFPRDAVAATLHIAADAMLSGVPSRIYTAGNPTLFVALRDAAAVDSVEIDVEAIRRLLQSEAVPTCVFVFAPTSFGAYSRLFAPDLGVIEDPATGSATGPLAAFMLDYGIRPASAGARFVANKEPR
jgi:trans-2,3-dihydro-3-hydroxyanthranilate isomerase